MAAENQAEENPKETNQQQQEKQQKQVIGEWKTSANLINSAENCAKIYAIYVDVGLCVTYVRHF